MNITLIFKVSCHFNPMILLFLNLAMNLEVPFDDSNPVALKLSLAGRGGELYIF